MKKYKSTYSKKQRLAIYTLAIQTMQCEDTQKYYGLCRYLKKAEVELNMRKMRKNIRVTLIMAECPEILKQKPRVFWGVFWFRT